MNAAATAPRTPSRLLASLARLNASHPHTRKRLLGVDVNHGRELLRALAIDTGGWVGWEATTLRTIADELTFVPLYTRGLRTASDVELSALITAAFDRALHAGDLRADFDRMTQHGGFRAVLENSILELRMAGVTPDALREAAETGSPAAQLAPVFAAYEQLIAEHSLVDPAGVFRVALEVFDAEAPLVLNGITALVPTLTTHGAVGGLVRRLVTAGAVILDVDIAMPRGDDEHTAIRATSLLGEQSDGFARSALGWSMATRVPHPRDAQYDSTLATVDLFAAASPTEELREVCRRVMREGLRWDDVEIAATDPDSYGIALDAVCLQLGIGATMLKGIPLIRTRIGRALHRWFVWLENGLPADVLRQAIEAGEIPVRSPELGAHDVAFALRAQQVGWGRARYDAVMARLNASHGDVVPDREADESAVDLADRRQAKIARERALVELLTELLAITPPVPERGSYVEVLTTTSDLAGATLAYIARLEQRDAADEQTMDRLTTRLRRLAALEDDETDFATALAGLRESLSDLRAWPPTGMARKPYRADGGLLHLTDLPHAGASGRERTFVVGLDAERTSGTARQDPLLPDAVRRVLGRERLPESADRRAQWLERLGVSLSALRGRVTLSWSIRGSDGRDSGPSPLILQTYRVLHGDAMLSYEQLRAAVFPPACAVPGDTYDDGVGLLDARDVWLRTIGASASLPDATALVRTAFPMLDAGLRANEALVATVPAAFHGIVPSAAALDPTHADARSLSPSALETLGTCPLQWFYRYGLGIRPPQDPAYDADKWLDALQRGSLLHEIFEQFVRAFLNVQATILDAAADAAMRTIVGAALDRWRDQVPPPGESVYAAESSEIRRAALAFLQMERDALRRGDGASWTEIEYGFGEKSRVTYALSDGTRIALRGRADRIDTLADGSLRVVDYKTGSPSHYRVSAKAGAFNGGRLLQPALYADAVGTSLYRTVSRFEYRFPTDRGGNAVVPFDATKLVDARGVVTSLVDHVRTGRFLPTIDKADCTYCDFAGICRVSAERFDVSSPRAEWAAERAQALPEYASMLERRGGPSAGDDA